MLNCHSQRNTPNSPAIEVVEQPPALNRTRIICKKTTGNLQILLFKYLEDISPLCVCVWGGVLDIPVLPLTSLGFKATVCSLIHA